MPITRTPSNASSAFKVEKTDEEWRKELRPEVFRILRQQGTERPRSSEYDQMYPSEGHFKCGGCGHPLYTSDGKFKSNCGWPCFDRVVHTEEGGCHVRVQAHGGQYEIVCNNCGGHLGHVFYGERCTENNERH